MRRALIILIAVPFTTGCNLVNYAMFNAVNEPAVRVDTKSIEHRAEKLAIDAWLDHLACLPDACPPESYKHGFHEGFKDYLLHGGSGAPPAIPPVKYRRKKNLSPEGQLEVRAYFGGFAAGAKMAKASGLRAFFVVPISSPMPPEHRTGYDEAGREKQPTAKTPATEELPAPKPVPDKVPMQLQNRPGAAPNRQPENIQAQRPQNLPAPVEVRQPLPFRPIAVEPRQPAPLQPLPEAPVRPAPFQPIPAAPAQPAPFQSIPTKLVQPAPFQPIPEAPAQPAPFQSVPTKLVQPAPFQPIPEELRQALPSPFIRADRDEPPSESEFQPLPPLAPETLPEPTSPEPFVPSPAATDLPREFNVQIQGGPASR